MYGCDSCSPAHGHDKSWFAVAETHGQAVDKWLWILRPVALFFRNDAHMVYTLQEGGYNNDDSPTSRNGVEIADCNAFEMTEVPNVITADSTTEQENVDKNETTRATLPSTHNHLEMKEAHGNFNLNLRTLPWHC